MFDELQTTYKRYTKLRDQIIVISRDVLRNSKQAIFALHRDEMGSAEKSLAEAESKLLEIEEFFKEEERLKFEGSYKDCVEEYVEAKLFYEYLKTGNVGLKSEVSLAFDDYLGGICDLTGELVRKAVKSSIEKKFDEVKKIQEFVSNLYAEFLEFDLRNSELRKKSDQIKYALAKIEDILYRLDLR